MDKEELLQLCLHQGGPGRNAVGKGREDLLAEEAEALAEKVNLAESAVRM